MSDQTPGDPSAVPASRTADERISDLAVTYMANSMAMPDMLTDQEQNWTFGHLVTFAHQVVAALASSSSVNASSRDPHHPIVSDLMVTLGVAFNRKDERTAREAIARFWQEVIEREVASSASVPPAGWVAIVAVLKAANDSDLPCGEVVLEEDGEICVDWHITSRQTLSVSVRTDGRIGWAALVGDKSEHQTCTEVTAELAEVFRQFGQTEPPSSAGQPPRGETKYPRTTWKLSDGRVLSLITVEELRTLPKGTALTCIDGEIVVVGGDKPIDEDTRGGFLAFGLEAEPPSPALPSGLIPAFREELAALAHDQWSGWMRHLFSKAILGADGVAIIPRELVARWKRQSETIYADLSEAEKNSDRDEADRVLALLRGSHE